LVNSLTSIGHLRIRHVDDSLEFTDLTASFLRRSDVPIAVTTSTNPEDALERFR
jgi:CheY-like chemotaxis protein